MKFDIDMQYLLESFRRIVNTPSPVGFYALLNPVLEKMAEELGYSITRDRRGDPYIILEGMDNSKTVMIGAHADTVGMVVRRIDPDGKLRIRALGGANFNSMEGSSVTVHTRDGRCYTGLLACQSHSTHVFADSRTMERSDENMMVILDENVHSKAEVNELGIRNGDFIAADPQCEVTDNGYLKSRYIDDKAAVACCFTLLKYLKEHGIKPQYRTILAFPYSEETGAGGAYVPEEVWEYVALDIGLVGPDCDGDEYGVSICAKDVRGPYDYDLTNRLINLAEKAECKYAVDVFYRYSTDANAAVYAGNNLRAAAFGMAVYCSHGRERTHIEGLENTMKLLLAYVLDI